MRPQVNTFVKLTAFVLLFVGTVGLSNAQGRGGAGTPAEQKAAFDANFAEIVTAVAITEEQAPKVKEILWAAQEKRGELMASMRGSGGAGNLARTGMREKMAEMDKETLTALGNVLTADQIAKYSEFQASRQRGRGAGGRGNQGNPQ